MLKHKRDSFEVQRMWNATVKVMPEMHVAGGLSGAYHMYLERISGKHCSGEFQKTASVSTVHSARNILM